MHARVSNDFFLFFFFFFEVIIVSLSTRINKRVSNASCSIHRQSDLLLFWASFFPLLAKSVVLKFLCSVSYFPRGPGREREIRTQGREIRRHTGKETSYEIRKVELGISLMGIRSVEAEGNVTRKQTVSLLAIILLPPPPVNLVIESNR